MTAEEIKSIRKSLALTQEEFAKALDVTTVTVGYWETGKLNPNCTSRRKINLLLENSEKPKVSIDEIENIRVSMNLSQIEFSKLLKVKPRTYNTWTTKRAVPSPKGFRKLYEFKIMYEKNNETK